MRGILLKLFQKLISVNNLFSKHNQNINMSYFDSKLSRRRIVLVFNAKITRRDTLTANCPSGELSGGKLSSGEWSGHRRNNCWRLITSQFIPGIKDKDRRCRRNGKLCHFTNSYGCDIFRREQTSHCV